MIEQDINERMAGIAPSQNVGEDPAILAIKRNRGMLLPTENQAPMSDVAQPTVELPQEPDYAARAILEDRRNRMMSSVYTASKVDPERAAKAQKLSAETGIGSGIALRHLDEMMVDARMREIERKNYFAENPVLANSLSDPEFAAVAQDDIGTLDRIGGFFGELAMFSRYGFSPSTLKGTARGMAMVERGQIGAAAAAGLATPQDIDRAEQLRQDMTKLQGGGLLAATAEVVTQQIANLKQTATMAAGGAAVGSAVPGVGTAAGGALGFAAGTITSTAQMEGGNAYLDMRADGVPDDVAIPAAIAVGFLNGAIEVYGLKLAASPFKGLAKKAMAEATAEALAKPSVRSALAIAGKEYVKQVGGEGVEEALQQTVSVIGDRIAKAASGMEYEGSLKKDLGQIIESFGQGALASVLLGGIGPGANLVYDLNRAEAAVGTQQFLQNLTTAVKEGTLKPRSPMMLERYIQAQAERYGVGDFYIAGTVMRDVINASGITPEQLEQVLPGMGEQVRGALLNNGDVNLTPGQYAATIAGTKFGDALMPHIRVGDPRAVSYAQAQQINANREQMREEATQIIQQMEQTNEAFVQSARKVEDTFRRQVEGAGRPREEADVAAVLLRDFYVTTAAKRGITPEEAYAADAVTIAGEAGVAPALEPLEQASTVDEGGVAIPKYRRAWHKAQTRTPITVTAWHAPGGSEAAQLTDFARERMGRNTTLGNGWYGARDRDIAETYGKPDQFEVTLQNPFVFSEPSRDFVLKITNEELQRIRDAGHDGIIVKGVNATLQGQDRSHLEVIAFNPEQAVRQVPTANIMEQAAQDAAVVQLAMAAQRGRRTTSGEVVITQEEESILTNFIDVEIERQVERARKKFAAEAEKTAKTPEELQAALEAQDKELREQLKAKFMETAAEDKAAVRETLIRHKSAYPVEQGWAFLELGRVAWIDKGEGKGKWENQYKIIPYAFERDKDGNALVPQTKEYDDRVNALASRMTDEVVSVHRRAVAGDSNASKIIRQARWYYAMRTRLRQEFGGLGDLFADLLGATSPNTPVRDNWFNAVDALRRAMRGDWDELLPKWIEWVEKIEELEVAMRAYLDNGIAANRPVAAIQRDAEYKALETALKNAREFPEELYPRKENEAKYGFNGKNIVRAMVDLWRTIRDEDVQIGRGATAPKALNFSGNLIGFRQRATIDVWAARELQRLAGLPRIPNMAEAGVAGSMLSTGATTGQFGFGQDVFAAAVKKIRSHPVLSKVPELAQINDDDLQALVWFVEKELWTINDWTNVAGEGGSFELEASLTGTNRQELVKELRRIMDASPPQALVDTAATKENAAAARAAWEPQRMVLETQLKELEETRKRVMAAKRSPKKADPADLRTPEQIEALEADIKATKDRLKAARPLDTALNRAVTAETRLEVFNTRKRKAAVLLTKLERPVDRFTGGLSEQQSLDTEGVDYVPTDADMAMLSEAMRTALYETDNGATVLASKVLSTQGRYGSVERSIDLEAVVRKGYDIRPLWRTMLKRAKAARQDSTFLSRILRVGEAVDPLYHRPGVEIYFRTSIAPDKLQEIIDKLQAKGVDMFTVIVDGRRLPGTMAGAMGNAVGVRFQYIPEFDQRYGTDLVGLSDNELREKVMQKSAEMQRIAATVAADLPEVSSALQLWHETRVAFASQYDEEIRNAESVAVGAVERVGEQARAGVWRGQSVREGIERADRHAREPAQREPGGADGQAVDGLRQQGVLDQAARGPARGTIDPRTLIATINQGGDLSTLLHEAAHAFLIIYARIAERPDAPAQIKADIDALLKWFGIAGATPEARLAAWNGMTLEQQKKYHERFAYNFEIYAWEGKAPSAELRGLFNRFRAYLTRIYKSIRDDLNAIYRREFGEDLPILTNEVRQVMDRMLASEEQIRRYQAINSMAPYFQTQEEAQMDDATWAAYVAMNQEAEDQAIADLTKASLGQVDWIRRARISAEREEERGMAARRREVKDEATQEVRGRLVYRLQDYLRTGRYRDEAGEEITVEGPHRLSVDRIEALYTGIPTAESVEAIRATGMAVPAVLQPEWRRLGFGKSGMLVKEGGVDPEMVAETFGYPGGDAMIRALVDAPKFSEAVEARTNELMQERYGEMDSPEAREQRISEAIHNEARARLVAVELRHASRATEPVAVMLEAARIAAQDILARKRLRDIRPQDHEAAEARAARDAINARRAAGNPAAAAQAAYTRAKNAVLEAPREDTVEALLAATEAAEAAGEAARAESMARSAERIGRFVEEYGNVQPDLLVIRAKRAQLYQNQLAAEARKAKAYVEKQVKYLRKVLRDENRKRMGAGYADQIEALLANVNLVAMSAAQRQQLADLGEWLKKMEADGVKPDISEDLAKAAFRVPYKDLTLDQFRELVEAVRTIEYMGKNEQKVLLEKQKAEFKEKEAAIVKNAEAVARSRGRIEKLRRSGQTRAAKASAKLRGFFAAGLKAWAIVEVIDGGPGGPLWEYLIRTANDRADMETEMNAAATKRLTEILEPWYRVGNMMAGKVEFPSIGRSMTREARLAIALNYGNAGNIQRLLDGEGWTQEQVQPILESLTAEEWDAVQQVWDFMDEYRPLIAAKERKLFGKEPNWVEPQELTVRTVDGKVKTLLGGYYPIVYDPVAAFRSEKQSEVDTAEAQLKGAFTAATTRRTFTKERAAKVEDRPLLYSLQGLWSGVTDVIHDLSWHEWLIDANRLMRSEEFDRVVRARYGEQPKLELRRWIEDVAAGGRGALTPGMMAAAFMRQNVSVAGLGYSIRGALLQLTGFSMSVTRVGWGPLLRGISAFAVNPLQTMRRVNDMSKFMEMRSRTQFKELNEIRNRVEGQRGWERGIRSHAYTMMLSMQRLVDIPTWLAGYENAIADGKDEDTAIALADQGVIATQGSGLLKDLSRVEREKGLASLFTVFYSYFNTVFNLATVQTMTARSRGKAAHDLLMILVVPVMVEQLLKEVLTPDGEDKEEKDLGKVAAQLTRAEVEYLLGMFVYVRELQGVSGMIDGGMRGYEGPAGLRGIVTIQRAAQQAGQGEFDRGFRRSAVDLLGIGLGLPSAQINRTIDGLEALSEGETENPLSAVMGVQQR